MEEENKSDIFYSDETMKVQALANTQWFYLFELFVVYLFLSFVSSSLYQLIYIFISWVKSNIKATGRQLISPS